MRNMATLKTKQFWIKNYKNKSDGIKITFTMDLEQFSNMCEVFSGRGKRELVANTINKYCEDNEIVHGCDSPESVKTESPVADFTCECLLDESSVVNLFPTPAGVVVIPNTLSEPVGFDMSSYMVPAVNLLPTLPTRKVRIKPL